MARADPCGDKGEKPGISACVLFPVLAILFPGNALIIRAHIGPPSVPSNEL